MGFLSHHGPFLLIAFAASAAGCAASAPETSAAPGATNDPVVYQGGATSAGLHALLAATPKTDPASAAAFDSPKDLSDLPIAPIVTFSWHGGSPHAALSPSRRGGAPRLLPAPPSTTARLLGPLLELLGPERTAEAQSAPLSGVAYYLRFSTAQNPKLHEVFTTSTTYTPTPEAWKTLAVGTWVTGTLISAAFENDALAPGGGPFVGGTVAFCIAMPPDAG